MKNNWQDYLKLIPVVYAFLVIVSFIKLYLFYKSFNIHIEDYLDLAEILVTFLNDIINYFFILLISYTLLLFFHFSSYKKYIFSNRILGNYAFPKEELTLHFLNKKYLFITSEIILVLGTIVILYLAPKSFSYQIVQIGAQIINVLISVIIIFTFIYYGGKYIINKTLRVVVFLGLIFLLTASTQLILEINILKTHYRYYAREIEYKDHIILSDSNQYFIGKSQNYIFYYNESEGRTTAFSLKDVGYIK